MTLTEHQFAHERAAPKGTYAHMITVQLACTNELLARHRAGAKYEGEIRRGMVFAWEPLKEHAAELCVVTRVETTPATELNVETIKHRTGTAYLFKPRGVLIYTKGLDGRWQEYYNEESRFREAVVKAMNDMNI